MTYYFKYELSNWVKIKGITRKDLIALLQSQYYEEFKGLDFITLSRWFTGKSVPPLYKQLYIAKCLDISLMDVLLRMDLSTVRYPNKYEPIVDTLVKTLNFSISNLSYKKVLGETRSEIKNLTYSEHAKLFRDFEYNLPPLKRFSYELAKKSEELTFKCILLRNEDNEAVGHWSGIADIGLLNSLPSFTSVSDDVADRSCLVGVGYYSNSKQFFELIVQALCYYILAYFDKKDFAYFFVVDIKPLLIFCKVVFGAEEIKYYPSPTKSSMGVYLLRFNLVKAVSNPTLLGQIKGKLECLANCNPNCNLCNLRDFKKVN